MHTKHWNIHIAVPNNNLHPIHNSINDYSTMYNDSALTCTREQWSRERKETTAYRCRDTSNIRDTAKTHRPITVPFTLKTQETDKSRKAIKANKNAKLSLIQRMLPLPFAVASPLHLCRHSNVFVGHRQEPERRDTNSQQEMQRQSRSKHRKCL